MTIITSRCDHGYDMGSHAAQEWDQQSEVPMPQTAPKPETLSRSGAIDILRDELIKLAGDEASICKVAAEKNIFCRGLHRFSDVELRHRFDWINARNPRMPRAEMEDIVDFLAGQLP